MNAKELVHCIALNARHDLERLTWNVSFYKERLALLKKHGIGPKTGHFVAFADLPTEIRYNQELLDCAVAALKARKKARGRTRRRG